ncbi:MAG: hypothetical protein KY467_16180 [Gemmatimonadetes bacterium]|nr:hypothetical protein [Gemmatimonadota bacterium]
MSYAKLFRTLAVTAGTLSVLSACAASGGASAGADGSASAAPRVSRDLITQEELRGTGAANLFDAVQRLRPHWLRGANLSNRTAGGTEIVVYQGNTPLGGLDALRTLQVSYPASMRWLDGTQATNTLPGLGSRRVAGAIVITLPGATVP